MKRVSIVFLIVLIIVIAMMFAARFVLTHPVQTNVGPPPNGAIAIHFPSNSGSEIHGWWIDVVQSRGVVILLPGVRANRLSMLDRAKFLHDAHFTTMLIDFQAIGESKGNAITFGSNERHDVLAAVAFARAREPHAKIAIIGSSLGGAATLLAEPNVDAMILEAVYPSIDRAAHNRIAMRLGNTIANITAPLLLWQVDAKQLRPIDHIANARCPVFILSGENDEHTTVADTRALFNAAHEPKQLWLVPGKKHVDLHRAMKRDYESRVLQFLQTSLAVSATASAEVANKPNAAETTSFTEMSSMQR